MAMREFRQADSERFEHVGTLKPLHFPVEAKVSESLRHLEQRTALYQLLCFVLRGHACVGSDQFVYYDASNPKACLSPDVYVKLGSDDNDITSWKTWERGSPDLAVEITSRSDAPDEPWAAKLARYHSLGIRELVRFDSKAVEPLRVWDYVDGDLAERKLEPNAHVRCRVLGLWWVTVPHARWGALLRLSNDAHGTELLKNELETETQARQAEAQARQAEAQARQAEAQARELEAQARQAAEARVRELEAELQRLHANKSG